MRHSGLAAEALPEFTVRTSRRARHVRLVVTAADGLVVVVPEGWRGDAEDIVASKAGWAERALATVADKRALLSAGTEALLPDAVSLMALGEVLAVDYRHSVATGVSARPRNGALLVQGNVSDAEACLAALRRWLSREASIWLPARCAELAASTGLVPTSVRISAARTRWGSCSSRGVVMLNRRLLFLPPDLVDALILHELAHLRVMNHSARFWELLESLDPHALRHRAHLKRAGDLVPAWADV